MRSTEFEGELRARRILHRKEDAGHDHHHQHNPGQRAEIPPIAQVSRGRIIVKLVSQQRDKRQPMVDPADDPVGWRGRGVGHSALLADLDGGAARIRGRGNGEVCRRRTPKDAPKSIMDRAPLRMSPASTTVEIAPNLAGMNIGNMLVRQIGHSKPRHAAPLRRPRPLREAILLKKANYATDCRRNDRHGGGRLDPCNTFGCREENRTSKVSPEISLRLALFEPDIPQNTGSLLRLAACFGIAVDLIEPCGFLLDDRRLRRTALDYAAICPIVRHASWQAFLANRDPRSRVLLMTTSGAVALHRFAFEGNDTICSVGKAPGFRRRCTPLRRRE